MISPWWGLITVCAENLVGLGFLWSASYRKPIPTHEKLFAVGKSGPTTTFNPTRLGLGWPWVGGVRRFRNNIDMFPNPTEFGTWYIANTL